MIGSFPGVMGTVADPGDGFGDSGEELELRRKNIDGVVNFFFILSFFCVPDWSPLPGPAPSRFLSFVPFMVENGGLLCALDVASMENRLWALESGGWSTGGASEARRERWKNRGMLSCVSARSSSPVAR